MNYDRTQRIRRAAILVANLEETLAEQMLESLPRLEAVTILNEVDRLGELDPEEVQDVLDEFRSAGRRVDRPKMRLSSLTQRRMPMRRPQRRWRRRRQRRPQRRRMLRARPTPC